MSRSEVHRGHAAGGEVPSAELHRTLGKTGFRVFPVVYGGIVSMRDGQEASDRYVAWSIERGVNYFDVAPTYEDAQEVLGRSLRPYRREVLLACKTRERLAAGAERELERSLRVLHTDYVDVYQMHALTTQEDLDQAFGPKGVLELMLKAQKDGRVRKLGITAHAEEIALRAMAMHAFDTVMFPMNWMLNMRTTMGSAVCERARQQQMGILSIKSMAWRRWKDRSEQDSTRYAKSWVKPIGPENERMSIAALRYSFQMGAHALIPPGDFNSFSFVVEHIKEATASPLTSAEHELLTAEFSNVRDLPFFD